MLKIVLSLTTLLILVVVINILPYPPETLRVVYILSFYFIFTSLSTFCRSITNAFEKMEYDATISLIEKIIIVSLCTVLLKARLGILYISCAFLVGGAVSLIVSALLVITKFVKPDFHIDFPFLKSSLRKALPFALGSIFVMIYSYIDQVMLSLMKGDETVGWYNASFALVNNFTLFAAVFMGAAYPTFSRLYSSSPDSLKIAYQKSFKYLFLLGLPITVGGMILADRIILLLYGNEYLPSVSAFRILIWAVFPSHLCYLFSTFMNSINRQGMNLFFMIISTLANILLNLILIPQFSLIGASIATVSSEVILFFLGISYLARTPYHSFSLVFFFKAFAANVIMACILIIFIKANLVCLILIGIVAYFISLFLFRCIDDEDRKIFKELIMQ
jgi:O-antigen/teichoic acid export membrane protein